MVGVDEFRSETQALASMKKAERRLHKIKMCIPPVIILTLAWIIFFKFFGNMKENLALDILLIALFVVNLGVYIYLENWFYMWKLFILPFRKLNVLLGFIIWLFYGEVIILCILFAPIVLLLYEMYLCKITAECAKDFA